MQDIVSCPSEGGTDSLLLRYHRSTLDETLPSESNSVTHLRSLALVFLSLSALAFQGDGRTTGPLAGGAWLEGGVVAADTLEVRGRIVDRDGAGVVSARVQILDGGRVLGATNSGGDGHFQATLTGVTAVAPLIRVERMGYEVHEERLVGPPRDLLLVLDTAPLPLPALEVVGAHSECRVPTDDGGRHFLEVAATLHTLDLDTLGIASYTLARTDTVADGGRTEKAMGDAEGLETGQRGSAPLLRISWERRVDREGYAFRVRRTHRNGSYDSWSYAPLEADFASHFLSEGFRRLHHLSPPEPRLDGGWEIDFCPGDGSHPGLRGRLTFAADTLLLGAEWGFVTPEPDEGAGGRISFPAAVHGGAVRLLPDESLTWRRLPDGSVQRRAQWYEGWILAAGDSVPFLPGRDGGE